MTLQRVNASMAFWPTRAYWQSTASALRPTSMTSSSLLHCAATHSKPALSMMVRSMSTLPKS